MGIHRAVIAALAIMAAQGRRFVPVEARPMPPLRAPVPRAAPRPMDERDRPSLYAGAKNWRRYHQRARTEPIKIKNPEKYLHASARRARV